MTEAAKKKSVRTSKKSVRTSLSRELILSAALITTWAFSQTVGTRHRPPQSRHMPLITRDAVVIDAAQMIEDAFRISSTAPEERELILEVVG